MPKWLFFTLLSIFCWGVWGVLSKPIANAIPADRYQALMALGLLPAVLFVSRSSRLCVGKAWRTGFLFGFLAGLFGGVGNIALFYSLAQGGKASIVFPLTALYPVVTIVASWMVLHERLNRVQLVGIGLAMVAIILLNAG
jgi:transporter family protein